MGNILKRRELEEIYPTERVKSRMSPELIGNH